MTTHLSKLIISLLTVFSIFSISFSAIAQKDGREIQVTHFTLENGLEVYLNEDHNQSNTYGAVVVKGGSSQDPADATGIAHYFEHIMFKGTHKIGTLDYKSERVLLDSIAHLYEAIRLNPDDDAYRKAILHKINGLSQRAAKYAVPNEFNQIIEEMGGTNINAYTSFENIVYYNAFPSANIEKWLKVYAHRFQNPVFRLFQSELETVYEEKNMSMDNPFNMLFEQVYSKFYPNSVYGQQTILGSVEHLKNPSIHKMQEYYKRHYVATNMALILSGNFETQEAKELIEKYFADIIGGDEVKFRENNEPAFNGRTHFSSRTTPIPIGVLGFRTVERTHTDALGLKLINQLLTNSESTGLLDNLKKENKLMMVQSMQDPHRDLGGSFIIYLPRPVFQSLKNGEKKVLAQLEKLKNGNFSDELFMAVKMSMLKDYEMKKESAKGSMDILIDAFMEQKSWSDYEKIISNLGNLTKQDIVALANKYYTENYFSYHSKMGFPKKTYIEKPNFTPVKANDEAEFGSPYAEEIRNMQSRRIELQFIDFSRVKRNSPVYNLHVFAFPNPVNNIFSIDLKIGRGLYHEPMLEYVAQYMNQVAPKGTSFEEFRLQLQAMGGSYFFSVNNSNLHLHIEGFDGSLEPILEKITDLILKPELDEKVMKKIVQMRRLENQMPKRDVATKANVLEQYALYGNDSYYLRRPGLKEVKKYKAQELIDKLHFVLNYESSIHYAGNRRIELVSELFTKIFTNPKGLASSRLPVYIPARSVKQDQLFVHYDKNAVQSHIQIAIPSNPIKPQNKPVMYSFNKYFGVGMSSLVFQEIREFRSLAYASWGYHYPAFLSLNPSVFIGGLTTQSDKTPEALSIYHGLLDDMPSKENRIQAIRNNLSLSLTSHQPGFRNYSQAVHKWELQGYKQDPRIEQFEYYKHMQFDDIKGFYTYNLLGKPRITSVLGNKKKFDAKELQRYGRVQEVKFSEMYKK